MRHTARLIPIAIAGLVVACVAPAHAVPSGLGLGVHGGYGQSVDAESGSPLAGAHLVLNLNHWLGAVAAVEFKFKEDLVESGIDYNAESYPLMLLGRVYLPVDGLAPYATAGIQYQIVKYGGDLFDDFDIDDSDSAFGWVAGAGVDFGGSESFAFFAEVLYQASDPERDLEGAVEDAKDFKYDQWSARAGITFFLN